jgi:PAS domain S-box-containing protein
MNEIEEGHIAMCLALERLALLARYMIYLFLGGLYLLGFAAGSMTDFAIITLVVVFHNAFAHWALTGKRYGLFFSHINFAIYFAETCLVVFFTGAEQSVLYVLFHLMLVGFSAYVPRCRKILLAGALACLGYGGVILVEWAMYGITTPLGVIAAKLTFIPVSAWLLGTISERLRKIEERSLGLAETAATSEANLRTILNMAADPILVCDENEFISDANASACEMLRVEHDELIGQRLRTFLFDDGTLPGKIAAVRTRGEANTEEILLDADGQESSVDMTLRSFVRDRKRYFAAIFRDITEQKNLREATRQAGLRMERLERELREVEHLKTGFLKSVSRRLRSPLCAILGYVEMLLDEELGEIAPEQRRALHTCRRGALRAIRVIDEARDMNHAGSEPVEAPVGDLMGPASEDGND